MNGEESWPYYERIYIYIYIYRHTQDSYYTDVSTWWWYDDCYVLTEWWSVDQWWRDRWTGTATEWDVS